LSRRPASRHSRRTPPRACVGGPFARDGRTRRTRGRPPRSRISAHAWGLKQAPEGADPGSVSIDDVRERLPPRGALVALLAGLAAGPLGLAALPGDGSARRASDATLAQVAARAGCTLTEFDTVRPSNPTIGGRVVNERVIARDGSYIGRPSPSPHPALHALMHGRVLVQYRRGLPAGQARRLDAFARADPDRLLAFRNTTRMRPALAATAYLARMTCPAVTPRILTALRAFRDRRRGFGQAF
jgi:hypothetical protein